MFNEKKLFITGGTGSIGNSICHYFNNNGCSDIYASTTNLNKIDSNDSFIDFRKLNLSNISQLNLDEILNIDIDFLVLNAGVTKDNIFLRMSSEEWTDVIDINLNSSFYLLKHFVKKMIKKRFGRIVFISSVVAHTGNPGQVNYSSAKAGLSGFTKSLAKEVGSRGITVNSVAPGFIETDMTAYLDDNAKTKLIEDIPLKRLGSVQDISDLVVFLSSEDASYITGQTISVDGGLFMY